MSSATCLSASPVTGEIILIVIWVLQLGHVVGNGAVELFTGTPFMRLSERRPW
jgi:hypothetical protein